MILILKNITIFGSILGVEGVCMKAFCNQLEGDFELLKDSTYYIHINNNKILSSSNTLEHKKPRKYKQKELLDFNVLTIDFVPFTRS